eukprot:1140987-Pelagomonas_calceolata.AAC.2
MIFALNNSSQTNICIFKVKPHAGIAGNECADAIAKYQANEANNSAPGAGIPSAGPSGASFWLAKEEKESMLGTHPQLLHPFHS